MEEPVPKKCPQIKKLNQSTNKPIYIPFFLWTSTNSNLFIQFCILNKINRQTNQIKIDSVTNNIEDLWFHFFIPISYFVNIKMLSSSKRHWYFLLLNIRIWSNDADSTIFVNELRRWRFEVSLVLSWFQTTFLFYDILRNDKMWIYHRFSIIWIDMDESLVRLHVLSRAISNLIIGLSAWE